MNLLILEDEPLVAKNLQNLLLKLEPSATVLGVISSVEGAQKWFKENALPDLILSDIQLSDGISFKIFETLNIDCPIIFTTAYDEYAIRAFKLNSIHYLLKPIDEPELAAALHKFKTLTTGGDPLHEQLRTLLSQWGRTDKKYKERFLTVHRNTLVPVVQQEIAFFQKEELIYINTLSQERLISEHHTLDEIESLTDPQYFFRVNRQFIIHIQAVGKIKTTMKGLTIQLKAPFTLEIDISREKATAFKKWMNG